MTHDTEKEMEKEARALLGRVSFCDCGVLPVVTRLAEALTAAREEGRKQGLEEAAKLVDDYPDSDDCDPYHSPHLTSARIAAAIRKVK
jgi:hypothetical protein